MTYRRGGDGTYGAYANQDDIRPATAAHQGLMSRADKVKLDALEVPLLRLNYIAPSGADLANGTAMAATTWVNLNTDQSFTVGSTASLLLVVVRGVAIAPGNAAATQVASRLLFDGATPVGLGGGWAPGAGFCNALAGLTLVPLVGFAAGAHTVRVQLWSTAAGNFYCRTNTAPNQEGLAIVIYEYNP
jgi:hypothetical protein